MQTDTKRQVYAGFFVRLTAFLVDMIIVNAGLVFIRFPLWIFSLRAPDNILFRDFIFQYSIRDILMYLLTLTYFVLLTYYTGSTLGKKLFALRVVSVEGRKMTFFEVVYRESIGRFLSGIVFHLGYLLILAQREHRGIHDILSDTCVIYYHEKKVYVHTQMNYRNMAPAPGYTVPPGENGVPGSVPDVPGENGAPESMANMPGGNGAPGSVPDVPGENRAPESMPNVPEENGVPGSVPNMPEENGAPGSVPNVPEENGVPEKSTKTRPIYGGDFIKAPDYSREPVIPKREDSAAPPKETLIPPGYFSSDSSSETNE